MTLFKEFSDYQGKPLIINRPSIATVQLVVDGDSAADGCAVVTFIDGSYRTVKEYDALKAWLCEP